MEQTKCLIIGSGPAGYTAGIYASRADLHPILIEGMTPGGQLTITTEVENFPGYPKGMSGPAIMDDIREQAVRCGTDIRSGLVTEVDFSKRPFRCVVDDTVEYLADTVIIATGATARWLGLESEKTYRGFGVSACATCDGNFFKGKDVAVVGGGDTALEEATYLAKLCNKVYLVHRRDEFRASKAMQQRVFDTPNIEVVWNSIPAEIVGEKRGFMKAVTGLAVTDKNSGENRTLPVDGVFVAIGHTPVTELFKGQIELDAQGYIVTKPDSTATNVDGVFAAGDVQDPQFRQAITAAASGCKAAIEAERFLLRERGQMEICRDDVHIVSTKNKTKKYHTNQSNMKKITTLFAMLICAITLMASPVEPEQARTIALNFMVEKSPAVTRSTDCSLVYTKSDARSSALFYVYNVGGGFVIVSADDAVIPVLGYSTEGTFDPQNIPVNCREWLQGYADEIAYVKTNNLTANDAVRQSWTALTEGRGPSRSGNTRSVAPLLTTTWDQSPWYNELCPEDENNWTGHVVTGCVATAMAQIIRYHQYPAHGFGKRSYTSSYGELSVNYDDHTYSYNLMPNELDWQTTPPDAQLNAVATLMRDCGVAVSMEYGASASSAHDEAARAAFISQFGYDAHLAYKNSYEEEVWTEMLKEELDQSRPIYYAGSGRAWGSNSGHAFVCDGYNSDDYFHFNWGWSGDYNGYFAMGSLTSDDYNHGSNIIGDQGTGFQFNSYNAAIFARPAETISTLLFNFGGETSRTISGPVMISDVHGLNNYSCYAYSNTYQNTLTLYPEHEGDQLRLDVLAFNYSLDVYDGENTEGDPIASNPAAGTTIISTTGALTLYFSGSLRCYDLRLLVAPISCLPVVQVPVCQYFDYQSADLTWEVLQEDIYANHTFNWQLEYGPQGFTPGTGTVLHPDGTEVSLSDLEADTYYDAYLSYTCTSGDAVTLDPVSFHTAPLTDCLDPIGNGTYPDYTCITCGYYAWSQQIFTADELAAAGLTAGDPISVLSLQYYGEEPLTRRFSVYMGHTDKTSFDNYYDWIDPATLTNVYPEANTTFTNTNPGYWFPLYFSNYFVWDGTSNIVIAYVNNSDTRIFNQDFYTHGSSSRTLYHYSYNEDPITMESGGDLTSNRLNIKFCTATNCMAPTNLTAATVSRTEARLNWDRMYQENAWTVEYGVHGFEQGSGTFVNVTGNPSVTIANLENGQYDFYVRAECGSGNHSNWRSVSSYVMGDNDCVELMEGEWNNGSLVTNLSNNYALSQQIFTASELAEMGMLSGDPIYSISVQYNKSTTFTRRMAVYMANTDKSAFANNSDWFNLGVLTNVFYEDNINFTATESGEDYQWITFQFDEPFIWDGSSNVVIAFADNTGSYVSVSYWDDYAYSFNQHPGNANNALYWSGSDEPASNSYGNLSDYLSNIRFCSGCMGPTHLTYTMPARHEVVFTWQPGHNETEWTVEYGTADFERGTGNSITVSGEPTVTISHLGRGVWDFYFQSDCGNGSTSLWKKVSLTMGDDGGVADCFQIGEGTTIDRCIPMGYAGSNFHTYSQQLYTASELTDAGLSAGSIIKEISFQYSGSDKIKSPVDIWIGNSSRANMSSDYFTPESELQHVFSGEVSLREGWVNIRLNQQFVWNGSSSLLVAVLNNTSNDDKNTNFLGEQQYPNMALYYSSRYEIVNLTNINPNSTNFRSNIRFCTDNSCTLNRTIEAFVNEGDSYDFYGRTISEQGTYSHRFYVNEECDSLILLNLTVRKIIYVTSSGEGAQDGTSWLNAMKLQEALDAAVSYTNVTPFIYVKAGPYTGNTSGTNSYEIKANARVYGGFNGDEGPYFDLNTRDLTHNISTLNGNNSRRVLYQSENFPDNQATVFDGFTIRGGAPDNVGDGGAVYLRNNTTLRNCIITGTTANISSDDAVTRNGITVYNDGGTLDNCTIYNNKVNISGNGNHKVYGVGVYSTNGTISRCTFRNNTTVYNGNNSNWNCYGGGIYLENNNTVSDCEFTLNSATSGGGICVRNTTRSVQATISNCIISNNTSHGAGGGVHVVNYYNYGKVNFNQCLIGNNRAGSDGGGIYDGNASIFTGCDIVRNSAASNAGGAYSVNGTTFKNSIIWGNKVGSAANHLGINNNKYFTFVNSAFPGTYSGAITIQEENSGSGLGYPMFTNPTAEAGVDANNGIGDWTLQEGSICIGLGNNEYATTETDLAGNARIQQERVDIGAYESNLDMAYPIHPEAVSNIIYVTTTGAGTQDGSSWSNATANLQYAMDVATGCTPPASVWMAKGTYTCEQSYIVHPNVAVYGSFMGNEPYTYDLTQRDFVNHATVLDGNNLYRVLNKTCPFQSSGITTYYTEPAVITMPFSGAMDITACSGTIYDNGGPTGNYSTNANGEIVIRSYNPNGTIMLSGSYHINYSSDLKIYDGDDNNKIELGNFDGNGNLSVVATSGVMLIQFTAGSSSNTYTGFELQFSCSSCEPNVPESTIPFRNGESLFDGITVQNGYDRNNSFGGGYLLAHTDLLNCTFTNNRGSGIHAEESTIENCNFTSNGAKGIDGSKLTINNSRIANNSNQGINGTNLAIANCVVENNGSHGININNTSSNVNSISNSIIRNNNSYGLSINGECKINECTVSGNKTYGLYGNHSGTQVFNTSIINNQGTGLYADGGLYVNVNVANNTYLGVAGVTARNSAQFTNCHIVRNLSTSSSSTISAGVSNNSGTSIQYTNCVIWGNMAQSRHANLSGEATYAYCAVEGGVEGTANITLDEANSGDEAGIYYPNFVNPSDTIGIVNATVYDYRLDAGSACINQGIANTTSLNLPLYDLAGSLRVKQGRIDIGAYEYGAVIVKRIDTAICRYGEYSYGEVYISPEEAGVYYDTTTYYENATDYIAFIRVTANETYRTYIDTSICVGESYFFAGEERTSTGDYYYNGQTVNGCDSIVTLHLTVLPHSTYSFSATRCDSYTWNDTTYYESGDYIQVFESANGCDSTVTLHLTITESTEYEFDKLACIVYNWNGITYRQSGDYIQHFRNAAGCDSTVTLHLTIQDVLRTEFDTTACDVFVWNDVPYTSSGDQVQRFTSSNDCDSIVTMHLTINHSEDRTQRLTRCDSYTWNDTTYYESGIYQQHFQTTKGCDSTVTLYLTINHSSVFEFDTIACDLFIWNDTVYRESGTYQQVLSNAADCDSVVTMRLDLRHSNEYEFNDTGCGVYVWNNTLYYESGDHIQVLRNSQGCDSTVTLHLTLYPTYSIPVEKTICQNELPFRYVNGQIDTTFGTNTPAAQSVFTFHLSTIHGCDSTINLTLTVNPMYDIPLEHAICQNELPYRYINGQIDTTFGASTPALSVIPFHLISSHGCDSTVTLTLTVHPSYATPLEKTICENELPYRYINGQIDTTFEVGTPATQSEFTFHLTSAYGCDSNVTLTLTVVPVTAPQLTVVGEITACQSSSATLSVEGSYVSYLWSTGATTPTIEVSSPGFYYVSVIDANGCSSATEMTQLGVSTLIPETPVICMVGVENNHNLVVWEELENTNVQNYRIYRENDQANVYELLATIPASQGNAYEDITADPSVRAYRYKVTAMDVCQGETPMSALHKTVHLTINRGIGNSWNLIWTHYEGFEFPSYRLYRGTANNNLELIATMPSTLTSYTDYDNVNRALFYQIEVVMNSSCERHTRDVSYSGSRSNIVYNGEIVTTDTIVTACEHYEWYTGDLTESNDYEYSYTSELGYDVHAVLHLTISHTPEVSISGNTTITAGSSTTLSVPSNAQWSYLWSNGATTNAITVSPTETTTYSVTVTEGACVAEAATTVTVVTGVNEWGTADLHIYPNPTTGIVHVELGMEDGWKNGEIQVFDVYGRMLDAANPSDARGAFPQTMEIDLSRYATGVYMLKVVKDGNVVAIGKVVKE